MITPNRCWPNNRESTGIEIKEVREKKLNSPQDLMGR